MANAIVALAPAESERPARPDFRASADFIAQLIACAAQVPQSRARRRAEPEQAVAAYRAIRRPPAETGRAVSRSL
jgi:hypothetical protein